MSRFFSGQASATDRIDCGTGADILFPELVPVTIIFWAKPYQLNNAGAAFFSRHVNGQSTTGLIFGGGGSVRLDFLIGGLSSIQRSSANSSHVVNKWQSFALLYDGGIFGSGMDIYINLLKTGYQNTNDGSSIVNNAAAKFLIGNIGAQNNAFLGDIGYFQIFNKILSYNEIVQATYYPGSIRNSLVGFWPLWGYTNLEPDFSGNNFIGSVTGTVQSTTEPPIAGIFTPSRRRVFPSYTTPPVITAVTFDAASSSGYEPSLSTYSWNHTVASQSNRFLEVSVGIFALGQVTSVTYAGVNLVFVRADVKGVYRSEIWRMVAPAIGTNAIVVTLNASLTSIGNAQSYYGVDQNEPIDIDQGNTGTNTPASASLTPETNACMILGNLVAGTASGVTSAGGQTSRTINNGALGTDASDEKGTISPIAPTTLQWNNLGILDNWAVSIIAIAPVQGVPSSPLITPTRKLSKPLIGVGL